ncbi:MAG: response regulator [Thermoanaerobaculales bacterium]|nr:response regulator [Thermoanaerobaculales bacterium]
MAKGSKTSVLVIDDDRAFARGLQILLEDEGPCVVRTACSLAEAMNDLETTEVVNLILGDAAMLVGKGPLARLRALRTRSEMEIVLLTTDPELVAEHECRALGVTRILPKPIDPEAVLELLNQV